jgi:plasmid stability protein
MLACDPLSLIAPFGMAQLVVRRIEDQVVRKLRATAAALGVSVEEAHRRILRRSLMGDSAPPPSFKAFLRSMPDAEDDTLFKRKRTTSRREVKL